MGRRMSYSESPSSFQSIASRIHRRSSWRYSFANSSITPQACHAPTRSTAKIEPVFDTERIALVTGATRGVGKGVAAALGAAGATVYVTGRSSGTPTYAIGGTIEQTAELVDQRGGRGVPVR